MDNESGIPEHGTKVLIALGGSLMSFLVFVGSASAGSTPNEIRVLTPAGEKQQAFAFGDKELRRGAEIATGDVDGDGELEIVATPTYRAKPNVRVFSSSGTLRTDFDVLDRKFTGGVNLAVGDVTGDGVAEIVIGARDGGGPTVEVYTNTGQRLATFVAYSPKYRGGVDVATGDIDGDGVEEIVTAAGFESSGHIRAFEGDGRETVTSVFPFGTSGQFGARVAVGDVDPDSPYEEIVVVPLSDHAPQVKILSNRGKTLKTITAFSASRTSGLSVTTLQADADASEEIAVIVRNWRPHLRVLNADGSRLTSTYAFAKSFVGDVSLTAGGANTLLASVTKLRASGRSDLPRSIEIDLSDQKLTYYRKGVTVATRAVSTGKWSMPTPTGTFKTRNKIRTAYSSRYALYMDYWMAVTPDGSYGIHALPFWKLKNGGRIYEGEDHLGTPVSHGCIRLAPSAARELYEWAPVGTAVFIRP
ncbi:MAG: L,D-transpeptidase family protein [Candidatus Kerfeldbacteria bacterium]|nr:L,D-transpeptidase family protein [Candidatus Kerfeldbacteria bacterium]